MGKLIYSTRRVKKSAMIIIAKAIPILDEYHASGYRVTLRQLHYQFVARGYMPNTKATYTKICEAMQLAQNFAFPLQQKLHELVSMLRYTYIACLVRHTYD